MPQPRGAFTPDVFVTRLHLRYDAEHFADDLHFRETADREQLPGPLRAAPPVARRAGAAKPRGTICAVCPRASSSRRRTSRA